MRLCRFDAGAGPRHGLVEDGFVADRDDPSARHALEDVRLLPPVLPRKFLAIGLNYADHIAESGMEAPQFPVFFNKQVTCVAGPDDDVHMPKVSNLLDYGPCDCRRRAAAAHRARALRPAELLIPAPRDRSARARRRPAAGRACHGCTGYRTAPMPAGVPVAITSPGITNDVSVRDCHQLAVAPM